MPSRTYLLSVRSSTGPATAVTAASAAYSSPRCAVCGPSTGPAHARPPGPGTIMAQAARARSGSN
eukprot:4350790-Lingulodinium_polyedra.AAC.1